MTLCAWALYIMLVLFGESETCGLGSANWLLSTFALTAGILTAVPLVYGLARLLLWPTGTKTKNIWLSGFIISAGVIIFATLATLIAAAISHYGCR